MNTESEYFIEGGLILRWERDPQPRDQFGHLVKGDRENVVVLQGDANIKELYRGVDNSWAKSIFEKEVAHYKEQDQECQTPQ